MYDFLFLWDVSEGYTTKASCENGIASVQKNAPEAEVEEE